MQKFGRSQSVKRVEDVRFVTGKGRYIDDITPEGAAFAYVLRSPVAHGVIRTLDLDAIRDMDGVLLAISAADLEAAGLDVGMKYTRVRNVDGSKAAGPIHPLLAQDKVRYVGEPVALIVAETLIAARDAAEAVELDIDELEPHITPVVGGETIHAEAPDNLAFDWGNGDAEACAAAMASAARVIKVEVVDNRVIVNPIEPRGAYAEMVDGRLHMALNGQGVWGPKEDLARHLKMDPADIRVTNPDTGGGFGMKAMVYAEPYLVAHAARVLNRPVRWMADRTESMLSDTAGRDLVSTATLGFDAGNKLVAYKVETVSNLGAHNSLNGQIIQTELFAKVAPGTYDVQAVRLEAKGIYTNTAPVDAYRGAGRPEAIFVLERAMDQAARELGVDPFELRRNNFIKPAQFPYTSATKVTYDVGDFTRLLDEAEQQVDRAGFAKRREAAAQDGKLLGMGMAYYIESILGDPSETARVEFDGVGGAKIFVGTQSNGQGHETVFAQFLSDQTGIPAENIQTIMGDSDQIATGGGTGGSRSVTVQNTATLKTVEVIVEAFSAYLAEKEGAEGVTFDDERFRIPGSNLSPTMLDVAAMAREDGRADLLTHSATITLDGRSFPNGCHVAEVEIDQATGQVTPLRYTVVDDFGNLINPMLAEGQVHGGVAQGLGQALMEQCVYDENGQLLSGSFMDYAMPRAIDVPWISFTSVPVPSVYNPMGMKGCGEAGTVGALAAVTNAVIDALGGRQISMPFTPHRVWKTMAEAGIAST